MGSNIQGVGAKRSADEGDFGQCHACFFNVLSPNAYQVIFVFRQCVIYR